MKAEIHIWCGYCGSFVYAGNGEQMIKHLHECEKELVTRKFGPNPIIGRDDGYTDEKDRI